MPKPIPFDFKRLDLWIPLFLLALPTLMALSPIVFEIYPRRRLYFTPLLPILFQISIIVYAIFTTRTAGWRPRFIPVHLLVPSTMLFAISVFTTSYVAEDPLFSMIKLFDLLLFFGLVLAVSKLVELRGTKFAQHLLAAIYGSVVIAIPLVAFLISNRIPAYYNWPYFIPGFDYIRIYGFALTMSIAAGTGLLLMPSFARGILRYAVMLGLIILWTTLFWNSSRGGIVALILVTPTLAVLIPSLRKALLPALIAMLIGAALSSLIVSDDPNFGFFNAYKETLEVRSVTALGNGRIFEWSVVLDFISARPFFGYGFGQTLLVVNEVGGNLAHTHNIILEIALAWGWVGAACAAFLTLWFWFKSLGKVRKTPSPEKTAALLLTSVFLVYALVDGIYFYYQAMIPLGLCVGILASKTGSATATRQD